MGVQRKSHLLVHKNGVNKKRRAGDFIHKLFDLVAVCVPAAPVAREDVRSSWRRKRRKLCPLRAQEGWRLTAFMWTTRLVGPGEGGAGRAFFCSPGRSCGHLSKKLLPGNRRWPPARSHKCQRRRPSRRPRCPILEKTLGGREFPREEACQRRRSPPAPRRILSLPADSSPFR